MFKDFNYLAAPDPAANPTAGSSPSAPVAPAPRDVDPVAMAALVDALEDAGVPLKHEHFAGLRRSWRESYAALDHHQVLLTTLAAQASPEAQLALVQQLTATLQASGHLPAPTNPADAACLALGRRIQVASFHGGPSFTTDWLRWPEWAAARDAYGQEMGITPRQPSGWQYHRRADGVLMSRYSPDEAFRPAERVPPEDAEVVAALLAGRPTAALNRPFRR